VCCGLAEEKFRTGAMATRFNLADLGARQMFTVVNVKPNHSLTRAHYGKLHNACCLILSL
jgi:hypothetical protein